jgi:hypothetical protein
VKPQAFYTKIAKIAETERFPVPLCGLGVLEVKRMGRSLRVDGRILSAGREF